jgi:hypothetical protein
VCNNNGFGTRSPNLSKNYKESKFATIDTGCGVKNQHRKSEVRAVPIYHLNQSGIRII